MTSILWITCFTVLLMVVVQAEAWLPTGFVKFRKHVVRRKRGKRQAARNNNSAENSAENNEGIAVEETEEEEEEDSEEAERKLLSLLPWWEDSWSEAFLNSFPVSSVLSTSDPAPTEEIVDELAHYEAPQPTKDAQVLHFCFLLHGHRGFSTDLSYLQRTMQHHAELEKREREEQGVATTKQDMIVHCATCNEGKTMDGVVNGGERMVQEILQVIRAELQRRQDDNSNNDEDEIHDITISIVGNSLGGIYGRYAIARLAQKAADEENHPELTSSQLCAKDDDNCVLLDGKYRLHFNIFCTTASPHLGISKHTYVPLPRSVELGAARVLGDTGRDLFRLNDLLKTMATCPTFLEPLGQFRKRIAYANAYGTDFPVPTSTAAFLSADSTYPHHFAENDEINNTAAAKTNNINRHVVATLHTPAAKTLPMAPSPEEEAIVDDLVQMSYSLDSLGWKKVFIDVRKEIPLRMSLPSLPRSKSIRKSLRKSLILTPARSLSGLRKSFSSNVSLTSSTPSEDSPDDVAKQLSKSAPVSPTTSTVSGELSSDSDISEDLRGSRKKKKKPKRPSAIHRLREKGVVESRDVASVVSTIPDDMKLSFPLGHNLMVALDRDSIAGGIYKGGRPVMDGLAKELVHDIFDWNFQEEADVLAEETLKLNQKSVVE